MAVYRASMVVNRVTAYVCSFVADDRGQDLIEYGLLGGFIATVGIAVFPVIVGRMSTAYTSWQTAVRDLWEPCPPGGCS